MCFIEIYMRYQILYFSKRLPFKCDIYKPHNKLFIKLLNNSSGHSDHIKNLKVTQGDKTSHFCYFNNTYRLIYCYLYNSGDINHGVTRSKDGVTLF